MLVDHKLRLINASKDVNDFLSPRLKNVRSGAIPLSVSMHGPPPCHMRLASQFERRPDTLTQASGDALCA